MDSRRKLLTRLGGLARTSELVANGDEVEWLRIARNYGKHIHVRQGWWALPDTPRDVLAAWRAGGRLACVSALAYHGVTVELGERLHVELAANSRGARNPLVAVHWSTDQRNGDRRAVSVEVALRQASRCRAATGTL